MGAWVNRTVLSGASIAENGTASHTCTFTAATAGNYLVAVVAGSVTFTTPTGWTLLQSAVNNTGLYAFAKTATASESSFSTSHNGSNYGILGVVYEYSAGSSYIDGNTAINLSSLTNGPAVGGLTGTYSRFTARSCGLVSSFSTSSCAWTLPTVEDYDTYIPRVTNDGVAFTIAYDDGATGSSFDPLSTLTVSGGSANGEGISFALLVTTPPAPTAPEVGTTPVTAVTPTTATGNGIVTSDGGDTITERGIVWATTMNPTTSGSKVTAAGTTGSFSGSLTGLTNNTLYYVRAYATNSVGTTYGVNQTFINNGGTSAWFTA